MIWIQLLILTVGLVATGIYISVRVVEKIEEMRRMRRALRNIIEEFEMDYMSDGEVVDNPSRQKIQWYEWAKEGLSNGEL